MAVISVILVVLFLIVALLLIGLVLLQNGEGEGLGGLFAGSSNSAFGSRSATVLTKVTYACVGLFFALAFFLALANRTPSDRGFREEVQMQRSTEIRENWWADGQAQEGGAVIEEADEDEPGDGLAGHEDASGAAQGDAEVTLPEQPGEASQDAEADTIGNADAALRPD